MRDGFWQEPGAFEATGLGDDAKEASEGKSKEGAPEDAKGEMASISRKDATADRSGDQKFQKEAVGGIGHYVMKPLQAMTHSIRHQFEVLTQHKPEMPSEFGPEYGRAMANHLPMALSALRQLGASPETLAQFEADYLARTPLRDVSDQAAELKGDPVLAFGRRDYYVALRNMLTDFQAAHGTEALLNLWVPKLTEGLSASAFHAVIRLGYALADDDTAEIVNALAFWASSFQSLGHLDTHREENPQGEAKIDAVLNAVAVDSDLGHQVIQGGGIASRLGRAARLPGYDRLIKRINISGQYSLADLRDQSLNIFLHQPSFTTLHLVTGAEALAQVVDKVAAPQALRQYYALALANVYISRGTPLLKDGDKIKSFAENGNLPDWAYLKSEAIASGDEHKIKFIQTCASEFEKTGDRRYQLAADVWLSGKQSWLTGAAR